MQCFALSVNFKTQSFDGKTYLIVITDTDDDKIMTSPFIMKFYLNDGSVFKLQTEVSTDFGISINWTGWSSSDHSIHYYRFEVTPEMRTAFEKGIRGFAINTLPEICTERVNESEYNKFMKKLNVPEETDEIKF